MSDLQTYFRIGIIGQSFEEEDMIEPKIKEKCIQLVERLAEKEVILLSGGDVIGYPKVIMEYATQKEITTIGIFPGYEEDFYEYRKIGISIPIYTGMGYGMRDILMIRSAEAVICIGGGEGTLNELVNAYHLYCPIFAIKNTGGWADKLANQYIDDRKKVIIKAYENVDELVEQLFKDIEKRRRFKYCCSKMANLKKS